MTLEPFFNTGLVIQVHIVSALLAFGLGIRVLWRRKGTTGHRREGRIWVALMAIVALSSFFINEIRMFGPFSPIHFLSIFTLASLVLAVYYIRRGNVRRHRSLMYGLFFGGLVGAGVFTFIPGRIMHRIVFGNPDFYLQTLPNNWVLVMTLGMALAAIIYWRSRRAS